MTDHAPKLSAAGYNALSVRHWVRQWQYAVACFRTTSWHRQLLKTTDPSLVTCPVCQAFIAQEVEAMMIKGPAAQ